MEYSIHSVPRYIAFLDIEKTFVCMYYNVWYVLQEYGG